MPIEIRSVKVELMETSKLVPMKMNPRDHSRDQVKELIASIELYGWTQPILVDVKRRGVLAGHGRLLAAKALKMRRVPVIRCDGFDDELMRVAYAIADNKIAIDASWNEPRLKRALDALQKSELGVKSAAFTEENLGQLMDDLAAGRMSRVASGAARGGRDDDDDDDDEGDGLDGGEGQTASLPYPIDVDDKEFLVGVLNEVRQSRKCTMGEALVWIVREWAAGRGSKQTKKRGK